ncbi:MAG TPA: glycosyltransferase family 4 protein, partial [Candidatus Angelobacter sp.]|nr:glycosyltransferase family 4 protein [Candidatus Angelobacter sp.]
MKVSLICCPFKTSFGSYAHALKSALERKTGEKVQWVGTNCGCGDPVEVNRDFEAKECDYFEFPILVDFRSNSAWKRKLRGAARGVLVSRKAKKYAELSQGAEVVHFQQILNAYGSKGVFSWLRQSTPRQPSHAKRIVTVHELDADQIEFPETNLTYNRADAVIAHCEEMRQQLIKLGVLPEQVHVVLHGTDLLSLDPNQKREGLVFYGGHKLMSGKGIESLFQAMAIIQKQLGDSTPKLTIHGHYGPVTPEAGKKLAAENGIESLIIWANQISDDQIMSLYARSQVCVLPYTGSFAGQPASFAAASALPVVCTRKAGLPDHLGETAIYVDANPDGQVSDGKSRQLAGRILELLQSQTLREQTGTLLRARAERLLGWDTIADQTLEIYQCA